jgi:hypothetical protein
VDLRFQRNRAVSDWFVSRECRLLSILLLALVLQSPPDARNPREWPLTAADALVVIPDVTGPIASAGDFDGDGVSDLVVQRDASWSQGGRMQPRLDVVSTRDGRTLRTLWSASPSDPCSPRLELPCVGRGR